MQQATPSRTALRVALRRAAHQIYDAEPLVFADPVAVPILGSRYLPELHRTPARPDRPFSVSLRAFLVARSRYAEDKLRIAVSAGVAQYVLLGAGLDTFAYRNPWDQLQVFEIDHPATQQWKQDLLAASNIRLPENLRYVPVDFETESLPQRLSESGFNSSHPTFFAWLGVVPYLTPNAFRGTLRFLAEQPPGSGLVLDYSQPRSALPFFEQLAHDSLAARVQLAGEPFQLFFTPDEMALELADFASMEDLGAEEINALYFTGRADHLRLRGSVGRMLSAWI